MARSPALVLPLARGAVADQVARNQHVKRAMIKAGESSFEARMPQLAKGSLECFLRFLTVLKQAMDGA